MRSRGPTEQATRSRRGSFMVCTSIGVSPRQSSWDMHQLQPQCGVLEPQILWLGGEIAWSSLLAGDGAANSNLSPAAQVRRLRNAQTVSTYEPFLQAFLAAGSALPGLNLSTLVKSTAVSPAVRSAFAPIPPTSAVIGEQVSPLESFVGPVRKRVSGAHGPRLRPNSSDRKGDQAAPACSSTASASASARAASSDSVSVTS